MSHIRFHRALILWCIVFQVRYCLAADNTENAADENGRRLVFPSSPDEPDPLGFSNVSSLYGPGAWSAWFLALVASYFRTFGRLHEALDLDTCAFLGFLNWSAIDVLRSVHAVAIAPSSEATMKTLGQYGAACTVLFWGVWHGSIQLSILMLRIEQDILPPAPTKALHRRYLYQLLALVLPMVTLQVVLVQYHRSNLDALPTWYWAPRRNDKALLTMAIVSMWGVLPIFTWYRSEFRISNLNRRLKALWVREFVNCNIGLIPMAVVAIFTLIWTHDLFWTIFIVPFGLLYSPLILTAMLPFGVCFVILTSTVYVFQAYLLRQVDHGYSCFFMPCAPQKISDTDQLYPLVFALLVIGYFDLYPRGRRAAWSLWTRWQTRRPMENILEEIRRVQREQQERASMIR